MLFNKKSMLTLFAGAALLSAASINGISASAADNNSSNPGSNNTVGSINDDNVTTKHALGTNTDGAKDASGTVTKNGTVSGTSDAHINVVKGYLVLETVPSLGFQDVSQSDTNDNTSDTVQNNDTVLQSDSFFRHSTPTQLSVLDARDTNGANNDKGGYQVNATLNPFSHYDSGGNTTDQPSTSKDFKLNLNGKVTSNDKGAAVTINPNTQLTSNGTNSSTVLSSNKIGGGSTSVSFNNGANGNPTSLMVPRGTPSGNYAAPINWTLNPSSDGSALNGTTPTTPTPKKGS